MEVKVLGPGCAKCKTTFQVIEKVIKENNLDVKLTKVDDIMEMMSYNIMTTPAVVVDGEVKMKGQVPSESDVSLPERPVRHLSRLESSIGSLQLRAGHYQQSHTPCRRSHGLLDNLQLSAQRNPWVRSCFHSGKLHHDLLLRTWHLSHGNTASQRYRHHSH